MKHIISLSGGIGSYVSLLRVLEKEHKKDVIAVFCDVLKENGDLYRFLNDIEKTLDIKIIKLCIGKTPFQLQLEEKFIYNSRVANCSKKLKGDSFKEYLKTIEDDYIVYLGFDWTEMHRCENARKIYAPHEVRFPMCEAPYFTKKDMFEILSKQKIKIPYLYTIGLSHNNCDGQCVRAGIGHYINLYYQDKNRFMIAENEELMLQQLLNSKHTHLKRNGQPYSLKQLRISLESEVDLFNFDEVNDIGGCACFID